MNSSSPRCLPLDRSLSSNQLSGTIPGLGYLLKMQSLCACAPSPDTSPCQKGRSCCCSRLRSCACVRVRLSVCICVGSLKSTHCLSLRRRAAFTCARADNTVGCWCSWCCCRCTCSFSFFCTCQCFCSCRRVSCCFCCCCSLLVSAACYFTGTSAPTGSRQASPPPLACLHP
jgi:hypothetical protein